MKWNRFGEEVEDNDPEGIYEEKPVNPEKRVPATPPNDSAAALAAYQQQLTLEASGRRAAEAEVERLKAAAATAPIVTTPADERKFFDAPITTTRELIREEMAAASKPANDFIKQTTRANNFASLKQQMKDSGKFPYLAKIEQIFDQAMKDIEPNVGTMTMAYQTALGYFISNGGQLNDEAASNEPATSSTPAAPVTKPLPPHARSTHTPPAKPSNKIQIRTLNENEKVIKRHNGWTHDAQYLFWTEHVTPNEIGHITPEQEKKKIKEIFGIDI